MYAPESNKIKNMDEINFYKVSDPYGEFSNFSAFKVLIAAQIWPTVEHYFQANKFIDYRIQDKIRLMDSPMDAAIEGRNRDNTLRDDWEQIKDHLMYRAVKAKFLQHVKLKSLLLSTGAATIIEHTTNDKYWGDGGDGSGKNMLGQTLMKVREELRLICDDHDMIFPPWIAFPAVDAADMYWRMGSGETYLMYLSDYMEKYGRQKYKEKFPQPIEWNNFYYWQ